MNNKCKKCDGAMRPGKAIAQTWTGTPDFPGDTRCVTMSPGGAGKLIDCMKCEACGWSVTSIEAVPASGRSLSNAGVERLCVGEYTITRTIDDNYWIEHSSGEGMETNREKFKGWIHSFYVLEL